MDLQMRAAAQNSAIQWANDLMRQGVSAAMIEDAVNALLVKIKEQILIDTLTEQFQKEQEQMNSSDTSIEGKEDDNLQDSDE